MAQPFARARAMFAAIAAVISMGPSVGTALSMSQRMKLNEIGPYVSRGKGRGGRSQRSKNTTAMVKRAAKKSRNQQRHKRLARAA